MSKRQLRDGPPLAPVDIEAVRDSFARLGSDVCMAIDLFYVRLFAIAPTMRALFPDDVAAQNGKFTDMLAEFLRHLDDPAGFDDLVERLGRRHRGYGARPVHYGLVEEALIWALARQLREDFTPEAEAAWKAFYRAVAARMLAAAERGAPGGAEPRSG